MRAFHSAWTVCLDGGSLAFSSVCWTSVFERLRVFAGCLNCDFMGFRGLTVIRGWLAPGVSFQCLRELYEPLHGGSCFGGKMAGKWRQSRVKAGDFFLVLVVVALLHQFLRVGSLFPVLASSLRCSSTALTDDRLMPVSWRWGAGGRVRTVRVGLSRVRAGSFPCLGLTLDFEHDSSLSLLGYGHLTLLQGPCFAFRFPMPAGVMAW